MRCVICKRESDQVLLFDGIYDSEMVHVCEYCASEENIPIIKKPNEDQLRMAVDTRSVRERMERISGGRRTTPISEEQAIIQGHVARLRVPSKKQYHPDLVDDYYWEVSMARRRMKISTKQLAERVGVDERTINEIEKGRLPKDFKELFMRLEAYLGVKLLNKRLTKIHYKRPHVELESEEETLEEDKEDVDQNDQTESYEEEDKEDKIERYGIEYLKRNRERRDSKQIGKYDEGFLKQKKENLDKIKSGLADFSKRDNMHNVTLNDLIEMKRKRERNEEIKKRKLQTESFIGEDLEIEE